MSNNAMRMNVICIRKYTSENEDSSKLFRAIFQNNIQMQSFNYSKIKDVSRQSVTS